MRASVLRTHGRREHDHGNRCGRKFFEHMAGMSMIIKVSAGMDFHGRHARDHRTLRGHKVCERTAGMSMTIETCAGVSSVNTW